MHLTALTVLRWGQTGKKRLVVTSDHALKLAEAWTFRVVRTVCDSWVKTVTVREQYGDIKGKENRGKGFTGWTATVLVLVGLDFARDDSSGQTVTDWIVAENVALGVVVKRPKRIMSTTSVVAWVLVTLMTFLRRRRERWSSTCVFHRSIIHIRACRAPHTRRILYASMRLK